MRSFDLSGVFLTICCVWFVQCPAFAVAWDQGCRCRFLYACGCSAIAWAGMLFLLGIEFLGASHNWFSQTTQSNSTTTTDAGTSASDPGTTAPAQQPQQGSWGAMMGVIGGSIFLSAVICMFQCGSCLYSIYMIWGGDDDQHIREPCPTCPSEERPFRQKFLFDHHHQAISQRRLPEMRQRNPNGGDFEGGYNPPPRRTNSNATVAVNEKDNMYSSGQKSRNNSVPYYEDSKEKYEG